MIMTWFKWSQGRVLAAGWRLVTYEIFNYFFNYPLYVWAMSFFGLTRGWLAMTAASLVVCAGFFWRYDRAGIDWLFANTAKEWEEGTTKSSGWLRKIMARIYKSRTGLTGFLTFAVASVNIDPVIVAVHYRKSHFNGITLRDWGILVASVIIGNLWWGARIGLFVEILNRLSKHF